jgi:beta-glucosidase
MNIKEILKELTVEEKVSLTSGSNMWNMSGVKRLNIPKILVADGPHGVRVYERNTIDSEAFNTEYLAKSTMFPSAAAMAATFNEELIFEVGKTIGNECNMFGVDVLLAPGVNQKRSPLGGRNFEYYSEDPFLSGMIASGFINGVQSTGVGACVKHFALNEQETQRRFVNSVIDTRTLHEMYLLPFEMAIKSSDPMMVMSAYNRVNGDYAGESSLLLQDILRKKWGYEGVVVSDWGGVQNKVKSIKNGMNIEMPGPSEFNDEVHEALNQGTLKLSELDASLEPLLRLNSLVSKNTNKGKKTDLNQNHLLATKVAEEAIVLLKNDGILPIKNNVKLGIVGEFAQKPRINGGGSATLRPYILENPLSVFGEYFNVEFATGYHDDVTNETLLEEVREVALNNEYIVLFIGTTESLESEGRERPHMDIPNAHLEVFEKIKEINSNIIVVLNNGSALNLSPLVNASRAIIEAWFLGGANATALVQIMRGIVNPSGRLSETFPLDIANTPHYGKYPSNDDDVIYHGDIINSGYRYYDTHKYPVMYPFGYGLSYTTFEYSNLRLSKNVLKNKDVLTVTFSITNTGEVGGYETAQCYVHDVESFYPRPLKELKGFKKVYLEPGETKDVTITLDQRAFSIYAVDFEEFRVEEGLFHVMIGSNVQDIHLTDEIIFESSDKIRRSLTLLHPYNNWEKYFPSSVKDIESTYRKIEWYEKEEPMLRVLKRLKKQFAISDEIYAKLLSSFK